MTPADMELWVMVWNRFSTKGIPRGPDKHNIGILRPLKSKSCNNRPPRGGRKHFQPEVELVCLGGALIRQEVEQEQEAGAACHQMASIRWDWSSAEQSKWSAEDDMNLIMRRLWEWPWKEPSVYNIMLHMGVVWTVKVTQGSIGAKKSMGENNKPKSNFSKLNKLASSKMRKL